MRRVMHIQESYVVVYKDECYGWYENGLQRDGAAHVNTCTTCTPCTTCTKCTVGILHMH
jgi:TPP-dependent indolepyruvate ferredoxin oxidoreductase alpha subunit